MGDELVPAAPTGLAPRGDNLPATTVTPPTGAVAPFAGNGASREMAKPAGGAVVRNLSQSSWLDLLNRQLHLLNDDLTRIGGMLENMTRTAQVAEDIIQNIDELSRLFEAPEATRSATDATATVAAMIVQVVRKTERLSYETQVHNAQAFLGLKVMNDAQDHQRNMGAGPKLLQTAGHR